MAILDADKAGCFRSDKSLIQTIVRAARNVNAEVIRFGDKMTESMQRAIDETARRRECVALGKQSAEDSRKRNDFNQTARRHFNDQAMVREQAHSQEHLVTDG